MIQEVIFVFYVWRSENPDTLIIVHREFPAAINKSWRPLTMLHIGHSLVSNNSTCMKTIDYRNLGCLYWAKTVMESDSVEEPRVIL